MIAEASGVTKTTTAFGIATYNGATAADRSVVYALPLSDERGIINV
jgi:hypothetical protein